MGDAMPKGGSRFAWNTLMGIATILALIGAAVSILNDTAKIPGTEIYVKQIAIGLIGLLVVAGVVLHFTKKNNPSSESKTDNET